MCDVVVNDVYIVDTVARGVLIKTNYISQRAYASSSNLIPVCHYSEISPAHFNSAGYRGKVKLSIRRPPISQPLLPQLS